jgi:ABC-2 type transport system permease protein
MSSFLTVLKFEMMHYFKNKVFVISTLVLVLLVSIGLTVPTIMEMFDKEETPGVEKPAEDQAQYGLYDPNDVVDDLEFLNDQFYLGHLQKVTDLNTLESKVESGDFQAGYSIKEPLTYDYVVLNKEMTDQGAQGFEFAYTKLYQKQGFEKRGVEYSEVEPLLQPNFNYNVEILGKDSAGNYGYTYVLVFGLYMVIIMYGQLIATSVASEKSNRTMELLVTSTKSTYLIFGKVLSGAVAGIIQFGLIIGVGRLVYALNAKAWDGFLDFLFDIPATVLLNFSVFGILGYLFFAFIYGALGALVSKTEDVSASATPITIIFVAVFMISIIGMNDTSSLMLKIASFIPFSSFLAMFVRISMGEVTTIEVIISLTILAVSTFAVGFIGAKIYRMGTLMYGNPVKLKDIPKIMKSQ